MKPIQIKGLIGGILFLVVSLLLPVPEGMRVEARNVGVVALLMAIWWMTGTIPIYATAFLPMVLFPLLKVMPAGETAINYGHDFVIMMLTGFFLAKAIENQNLHKRIALVLINKLGTSRRIILLSIMIATAFISMWIANVTAALLMLPIGLALIAKEETDSSSTRNFGVALMLGIAYSASIGGVGTIIGSPTNMILGGVMMKMFPNAPLISFFEWLKIGLPILIIFLPITWYYLTRYYRITGSIQGSENMIANELKALGNMTKGEKWVMFVFFLTSFGWVFREDIVIDQFVIPGWSTWLNMGGYVQDSTVGMFSTMLLFLLPAGDSKRLLDWKSASQVPWGVGVIVGGGYAVAEGFKTSGLATWLGNQLTFVSGYPSFIVLIIVVIFILLFTEMNSNTATANIFLPVLASMGLAAGINPLLLMIPATIAASFAFIMPAGTGPNTVIFASEKLTVPDMAKAGTGLKIITIILLPLILYYLILPIMGLEQGLPVWAK
ncbi:MAG: DASS family sodium-coupled anion symporter [Bacteroidales bacterium]|nr:DASS family sodium-coupled anion symporter [Bacteroidales bacterium]